LEIPEVILKRKSIRAYASKELTDADVETLIKAATNAPSAGNMQPWAFVAVKDREMKEALVEVAHGQSFIAQAAVIFVVCTDVARTTPRYGERGEKLYSLQDTAAAVMSIMITATHNGLGSCWIGAFDEGMAAEAIGLPKGIRPVALVPLGYPAQNPTPRPRRPIEEVLHKDHW
jgi:nitroreductase